MNVAWKGRRIMDGKLACRMLRQMCNTAKSLAAELQDARDMLHRGDFREAFNLFEDAMMDAARISGNSVSDEYNKKHERLFVYLDEQAADIN
ncbi:MAG: hypothetical protein ACYTEQ_26395 [Planctomycetota bacterium]